MPNCRNASSAAPICPKLRPPALPARLVLPAPLAPLVRPRLPAPLRPPALPRLPAPPAAPGAPGKPQA